MSDHSIQDLSFEAYKTAAGVSSSMLKILRERSPLHLIHAIRNPSEPTEAQKFGALCHAAILTPDLSEYHVRPAGLDGRTKDGKQWATEHADLPVVSFEDHTAIIAMRDSVHSHPVAARLFKNADFERSLFFADDKGTLRKLRPDILPRGGNVLPDLKTCGNASPDAFSRAISDFGYYTQLAYYLDGCAAVGRGYKAACLIAVEKAPPYACAVYQLDPVAVDLGRMEYERDLVIYRECLESNRWPGYPDRVTCISLPQWKQKELEQAA